MSLNHVARVAWVGRVAAVFGLATAVSGLLPGVALAQAAGPSAAEPLVVCMAADNPPLSYQQQGQPKGLDVRLAQAVAQSLGRPLKVLPFESDYEKESQLSHEVNALLSSGVCQAASGYPLLSADVGKPSRPSARTPDYPGAPRRRDRPFVPLNPLAPSHGYLAAALGLVLPGPVPGLQSLADLSALDDGGARKVGIAGGTTASALAMSWRNGILRKRITALNQREDPFEALIKGQVGALLMSLARFDGWKREHPDSPLQVTAWRRPIGINLGFVTLSSDATVQDALNRVIDGALADGRLAAWAAEEGVSWTPPQKPDVGPGPSMADLARD